MTLTEKDVDKALAQGFVQGFEVAKEHLELITTEINRAIRQTEKTSGKYTCEIKAIMEFDLDAMSIVTYGKFKAPRADMVSESDTTVFPMDDPNQPGLPFDNTDEEDNGEIPEIEDNPFIVDEDDNELGD